MTQENEDNDDYQGENMGQNENYYWIDMSMTGVESLERDEGSYKYLYCELKYMS